MKTRTLTIVIICLAVMLYAGCGKSKKAGEGNNTQKNEQDGKNETSKQVDPADNQVILEIASKKYTINDFKKYLRLNYSDMDSEISPNNKSTGLISRLFDQFVEHKIILFAAEQEKIEISEGEIDKYLVKFNISRQNIEKEAISEAIKVQKYLLYKIYNHIEVPDKEIQDYYNKNMEDFRKKPEVALYQILVKDKETAQRIRGILINSPEKFEEIAAKESVSMEKDKGGFMGNFEKGTLPKDMEDVVFSLNPDTISPVVQSSYGFHIFKIKEKKKERLMYIEKVRPYIHNILMTEKMRIAYQDFLTQKKNELTINIKINELNFNYQKNVNTNDEGDKGDENDKKTSNANPGSNPGIS